MAQVDRYTADIIRWYLQEKMLEIGKHPTPRLEFGYGTISHAVVDFFQWAAEEEYLFKLTGENLPSNDVLETRVRSYVNEANVTIRSREDAKWIATQIRKRATKTIAPHNLDVMWKSEKVLHEDAPVTINKPVDEEESALPVTYDNSLDSIRDMAKTFRDFTEVSDDKELVAILSTAELSLLRLLMERL